MRIRCIAFVPPATVVTGLLLILVSWIMSGLESRFSEQLTPNAFEIVRHETECEMLARRVEEVARGVQSCEAFPGCLPSQNICPVAMQQELAGEYESLRLLAKERCTEFAPLVTRVAATCSMEPEVCSREDCRAAQSSRTSEGFRATTGTYFF